MTLNELQKVKVSDLKNVTPGIGITAVLTIAGALATTIGHFVSLYKAFKSTSGSYKTKESEYKWDNNQKNAPRILENYILF
ncbi:hypothetical protein [Mycoplasma sp. 48589B]